VAADGGKLKLGALANSLHWKELLTRIRRMAVMARHFRGSDLAAIESLCEVRIRRTPLPAVRNDALL
jgi:hypothetical protein